MISNAMDSPTLYGLSTDTKPLYINNGTKFIEIDSGDVYYYDRENDEWKLYNGD